MDYDCHTENIFDQLLKILSHWWVIKKYFNDGNQLVLSVDTTLPASEKRNPLFSIVYLQYIVSRKTHRSIF